MSTLNGFLVKLCRERHRERYKKRTATGTSSESGRQRHIFCTVVLCRKALADALSSRKAKSPRVVAACVPLTSSKLLLPTEDDAKPVAEQRRFAGRSIRAAGRSAKCFERESEAYQAPTALEYARKALEKELAVTSSLRDLGCALPIGMDTQRSGLASLAFPLPPGPTGERLFAVCSSLVDFVSKFPQHGPDRQKAVSRLLDMLEEGQVTGEELKAYDYGEDGTAPQNPLHVMERDSLVLYLLEHLPSDIERPRVLNKQEEEAEEKEEITCALNTCGEPSGPRAAASRHAQLEHSAVGAGVAREPKRRKLNAGAAASAQDDAEHSAGESESLTQHCGGAAAGVPIPSGANTMRQRPPHRAAQEAAVQIRTCSRGEPLPASAGGKDDIVARRPRGQPGGNSSSDGLAETAVCRRHGFRRGASADDCRATSAETAAAATSLHEDKRTGGQQSVLSATDTAAIPGAAQQSAPARRTCGPSSPSECPGSSSRACDDGSPQCDGHPDRQAQPPPSALALVSPVASSGGCTASAGDAQQQAPGVLLCAPSAAAAASASTAAMVRPGSVAEGQEGLQLPEVTQAAAGWSALAGGVQSVPPALGPSAAGAVAVAATAQLGAGQAPSGPCCATPCSQAAIPGAAQQSAPARRTCGPSSPSECPGSSSRACDDGSPQCDGHPDRQAQPPPSALALVSPVASSGGCTASARDAQQQAPGMLLCAPSAAAAASASTAAMVRLGSVAEGQEGPQLQQQLEAEGSFLPGGSTPRRQDHVVEPLTPHNSDTPQLFLRTATTPAFVPTGFHATPRETRAAFESCYDAVCEAVWTAVQKEEEEAASSGRQPGDGLYCRAFHILLLWLSVSLGNGDFREPQPGSLDDLQRQLVARTRGLPGLPVQALLDKAVQLLSNEAFVAKLRACTNVAQPLGEGSSSSVYEVERNASVLRIAKGGWGSLRTAAEKIASPLIHHLRVADLRLGAPVLALVPVVYKQVPRLGCETFKKLLLGGGDSGVAVGMVLAYQKPLDRVYEDLWADKVGARRPRAPLHALSQVGWWRRARLQALSYAVLALAHKLNEARLTHADLKADNLALPDQAVAALDRLTAAPPESHLADFAKEAVNAVRAVAIDADGVKQLPASLLYNPSQEETKCYKPPCHEGYLPPTELALAPFEAQSFKAALVVETLVSSAVLESEEVMLPEGWSVTRTPQGELLLWKVGSVDMQSDGDVGLLPIFDAAHLFSAETVQLLASLRHPLADLRWELTSDRLSRQRRLAAAVAARTIGRDKSSQPGGSAPQPLLHAQADCLASLLEDLDEWDVGTWNQRLMALYREALFEAAHYAWAPNAVDRAFGLLLLEMVVRCDVKRTRRLVKDCGRQRKLMMCELSYLYHGRSLLHLLMASGNTEAVLKLLQTLHAAGADRECQELLAHTDKNGDTAAMLAAVHGRLETLEALVDFVRERLGDAGKLGWLEWLLPQPGIQCDLGGILAIICRQYNDRNTGLSDDLSHRLPTMQLAPQMGGADSGEGAGEGPRGSSRDEELAALIRKLAEEQAGNQHLVPQPVLAVPSSSSGPSAVAPGSSGSGSAQPSGGPDHRRGTWAGLLRALLQLPKSACVDGLKIWTEEKAYEMAKAMLLAKTSADLGGNTAFHLHAAMAGNMWALYSHVVKLYGEELGRRCLQAENAEEQTPVEVLLQCHGVMCSKPGSQALIALGNEIRKKGRRFPNSRFHTTAKHLRSFLDKLASLPPGLQCSHLQDQLDMAVKRLLGGLSSWSAHGVVVAPVAANGGVDGAG